MQQKIPAQFAAGDFFVYSMVSFYRNPAAAYAGLDISKKVARASAVGSPHR